MWVTPLIFCALTTWVIHINATLNPAPPNAVILSLLVGIVAGLPFGVLRGLHTDVRLTDRPGVMYLGSSWITMLIYVAAFGLRYAVRMMLPSRGVSSVIGDALLAFALGFIVASYVVIYQKYERELAQQPAANRLSVR